jgi:hypothetical protein
LAELPGRLACGNFSGHHSVARGQKMRLLPAATARYS